MNKVNENKKPYVRPVVETKEIALGVFGDYSNDDCDRRHHHGGRDGGWFGWH